MMSLVSALRRVRVVRYAVVAACVLISACGEEVTPPDPALAPFVGDWNATAMTLTSLDDPPTVVDLIEQGATFSINIQPSGRYTAILIFAMQTQTELGSLEVSGSTVTLRRNFPTSSVDASVFRFEGSDRLILDGDSEFDFNLDGTPEEALAHFALQREIGGS